MWKYEWWNKQPTVSNPNEHLTTTNREMYENKLGMNHLNVQKQDGTAYMNTRPLLMDTKEQLESKRNWSMLMSK